MRHVPAMLFALGCAQLACSATEVDDESCSGKCDSPNDSSPFTDPAEFLSSVDGLSFTEESSEHDGYRRFIIEFEQPLDHSADSVDTVTFKQRIVLHHRDATKPFILYTSGYQLFGQDFLAELTTGLDANQISVEQRFFGTSITDDAEPNEWELVRIEQAANDHHRIVDALKPFYTAKWLSTGHSKGGMTSVFHRRFFPNDVDATVAYVTPISFALPDSRYHQFFDSVGNAACRDNMRALQGRFLELREDILFELEDFAFDDTNTFDRAGGLDVAIEDGIVWFPWIFYQSQDIDSCADLPNGNTADDFDIVDYFFSSVSVQDDFAIEESITYTYQAAVELGYPSMPSAHLNSELAFADLEIDRLPAGVTRPEHVAEPMLDIEQWVQDEGEEILFIYGNADPWIAGAYDLGTATGDVLKLVANRKNHHALIADLSATNQAKALSKIERWIDERPTLDERESRRSVPPSLRVNLRGRPLGTPRPTSSPLR